MIKNLGLKKHQLDKWLQLIEIRQDQIKALGVSQLAKSLLNTRKEEKRKKGGS